MKGLKHLPNIICLLAASSLLFPAVSNALTTLVTDRVSLAGNDYVDWAQLGSAFTVVPNPSSITSNLGLTGTVGPDSASALLERRNQGNGWAGNFAPGDALIWTRNTTGAMIIDFNSPVFGVGAQIQRDLYGSFTGSIEVFDAGNFSLGLFSLPGSSSSLGDNSAIFLGVLSDSANIDHILFYTDDSSRDFAINRLDLVTGVPERLELLTSVVPEPAIFMLLAAGLAGLGLAGRFRRK